MNWPSHLGLWSPHLSPGQRFSKGYKSFQGCWGLLSPGEPQLGLTIASWAEERETGGELLGLQVRGVRGLRLFVLETSPFLMGLRDQPVTLPPPSPPGTIYTCLQGYSLRGSPNCRALLFAELGSLLPYLSNSWCGERGWSEEVPSFLSLLTLP